MGGSLRWLLFQWPSHSICRDTFDMEIPKRKIKIYSTFHILLTLFFNLPQKCNSLKGLTKSTNYFDTKQATKVVG